MHPALEFVAHRPWPLPAGPWLMAQSWHDLLFAHWPTAPEAMRPLIPPQLALDLFEGQCWVGIAPFWMSGVRARGVPAIAGVSCFPELNVRSYVAYGGKPGVYFFSLDAGSRLAVRAGRTFYHLPYFFANMKAEALGDEIVYDSARRHAAAEFHGRYRPIAPVEFRKPGTLEHWLTERYCLYTVYKSKVYRGEIHHAPWPVQDAQAEIRVNSMASAAGIVLTHTKPLLHFAKRLDALIWALRQAT